MNKEQIRRYKRIDKADAMFDYLGGWAGHEKVLKLISDIEIATAEMIIEKMRKGEDENSIREKVKKLVLKNNWERIFK